MHSKTKFGLGIVSAFALSCAGISAQEAEIEITLTIEPECTLTVDGGSSDTLDLSDGPVSTSIEWDCNGDFTKTITVDGGNTGSGTGRELWLAGVDEDPDEDELVSYSLTQGEGGAAWQTASGPSPFETDDASGSEEAYASLSESLAGKQVGTYSDLLTVEISYD